MSPKESQQPIIETTGVEKPKVPQTSEDYQALVVEPIPEDQRREYWYPTEGEPTLDVPVVRVDGAQSDSESAMSDAANVSEQEVPARPGEFDESTVEPVVRNRNDSQEKRKPGRFKKGLAIGTAAVALSGAAVAGMISRGADEAPKGDKTELDASSDRSSVADSGAMIAGGNVSDEADPQPGGKPIEAVPETNGTGENTDEQFEYSPNTTVPQPNQEPPVIDNETVFPATPENQDSTAEVEKAAQSVVMLADFFMGNAPLTGIYPSIDMENQTITYQGEGFSVSISGEMSQDGILKQDPLDALKGFSNITISNEKGVVSTMMDKTIGQPAIEVIIEGSAFTTSNSIYPNAKLDKALTVGNAQQIAKEIQEEATQK